MKRNHQGIASYLLSDWLSALLAWASFFIFRKTALQHASLQDYAVFLNDSKFYIGILLIPLCWLLIYFFTGTYYTVYRKSRISEISKTFFVSLFGVIVLFFTIILDDQVQSYTEYYESVLFLLLVQFLLTGAGRLLLLNRAKQKLDSGRAGFNTLVVGGNKRAIEVYLTLQKKKPRSGNYFIGFIDLNGNSTNGLSDYLPKLGKLEALERLILEHQVEEVVVAIETSEHHQLNQILHLLISKNVVIKIIPDNYDILLGSVRMSHVLGEAFIEIYPELMSRWQYNMKRTMDISISIGVLLLLSPLYLYCALRVKAGSPGPVFYSQKRVGLHGKHFLIYKFRSMVENAEKDGPLLSNKDDQRVTAWGRIMRKWRLDELPQFFNVLKGDMSLVGPRPEREFYIHQIVLQAPDYKHLQRVKPGLTSWGMVKYGYAENVEEMIRRMKFDLVYIENMSLLLDFKIMLYTIRTILQGRGV